MFYEVKDKRIESATQQTKWWVTAGFCGVVVTGAFIGVTLWLGTRQQSTTESIITDRILNSGDNFNSFNSKFDVLSRPVSSNSGASSIDGGGNGYPKEDNMKETTAEGIHGNQRRPQPPPPPSLPPNNKKAKIEKVVDFMNGEKVNSSRSSIPDSSSSYRNGAEDLDYETSGGFKPIVPNLRKKEHQHIDRSDGSSSSVNHPEVESSGEQDREHQFGTSLGEGVDPIDDSLKEYVTGGGGGGGKADHRPVAKKSEAIYPHHEWIEEEKVHEVDSMYKQGNDDPNPSDDNKHNYKFDQVYESHMTEETEELRQENLKLQPSGDQRVASVGGDGKFKLKTIPAFTYMKENKYTESDIPPTSVSEDYPYYYQKDQEYRQGGPNYDGVVPEDTESPIVAFLKKRLKDLNKWFATVNAKNNVQNGGSPAAGSSDWSEVLAAVNQSLYNKNTSMLFSKFKEMYYNSSDVQEIPLSSLIYPKNPTGVANNSNLISFGLLAIDLFLLHNVQQIAWNEENDIRVEMLKDPDIMALNALFLPPEKILQMKNPNSRFFTEQEDDSKHGALHELMEFINGGLRAVLNLGKAYRSSTRGVARSNGVNTLDCIWTLYCRNLDKTAKLNGPYGFLAKMNSLGLRLMMGEFPVERAFENLIRESTRGWRELDCQKLFPRCDAEEAKEVVIQTALGQNVPK